MAKGNLFLGFGRGAIGDIVLYRSMGEQLSRARNRHPRNPRSVGQLYQRAIMATVMRAYAAGSQIFDHSFQGFYGSAASQRQFMSVNSRLLRRLLAQDVEWGFVTDETRARCVAPGTLTPVCFDGMIVSQGSYDQRAFVVSRDNLGVCSFKLPDATPGQTKAEYAAAAGLIAGDIYTIVVIDYDPEYVEFTVDDEPGYYGQQLRGSFAFVRFRVLEDFVNSPGAMTDDIRLNDIFKQEESSRYWNPAFKYLPIRFPLTAEWLLPWQWSLGHAAIIRSRTNCDLRSNSSLFRLTAETSGISSEHVLAAWQAGTQQLGSSELILEGGDI